MESEPAIEKRKARILRDIERLKSDAAEVRIQIDDLSEEMSRAKEDEADWEEERASVQDAIDSVEVECDNLSEVVRSFENTSEEDASSSSATDKRNQQRSLEAISSVGVISADLSYITFRNRRRKRLRRRRMRSITGFVRTRLLRTLKRISAHLYKLISSLVNPTGWSLRGGIGTNLFMFQGRASLAIHFGD